MKKYILLLTLPVVCAMSAWAQVTVTQTAANQWQFGMPAGDVEVRIAYSDIAAFSTEPAAVTGLVYTGAAQELITAGASDEGTLYYRLGTDGTWLTTLPTGTEVGSYSVYYYIAGDANHNDSEVAGPIAVSIEKGTPAFTTLPAVIPGGLPFTGEAQTLVTAGTATAGTIEYSLDEISWSADLPTAVNIGAYSVYYRIRGNANYNDVPAAGPLTAGIINPLPVEVAVGTDGAYAFTKPAYDIEIEVEYYDDAFFPTGGEPKAVPSLVYSGTPQALVTAGVVVGGTMEYSLDGIIWSTDIPQVTDAGDYTVSYRVVGDATHGSLAPVAIATGISKKELTVTADDFTIAYGEAAPVYTAVYTGWQGADDASVLTTPVAFACAYTQGSAVGTYSITPNSAVAANYAITFVPGTLTVQSKSSSTSADITAFQTTGEELVYNGARNKPTVTVKDGTTPLTEGVDYTLTYKGQAAGGYAESTDAPIEAGAYYAVVTLAGNYSGTLLAGFTIQKALLTVTADDYTIAYGEAAPAYSAVYTGWQGADDASVLTTPVAFACAYTQGSAVGTYSITPNSAVAANYAITFVPGTLTVQSKSSSTSADITATQATGEQLVYNGTRNKPTVVVKDGTTPLTEGVDYTLTYKGQAAGGYAESTDAPIEVGDYYAVVTLAGNYSGIMHAAFTIAKAPLTVTAGDYTIAYGEAAPAYSAVYAGWQGADDASVLTTPVAFACVYTQGSAVGTYSITPNSAVAANYAITFVPGTLTVQSKSSSTSADITATQATGEQLVYNGTRNKPTVVVKDGTTPLTEGVDYTLTYKGQATGGYAESAYAPIDAGAYYAVVTLAGNYSGIMHAAFTIAKAPLTVTADDYTIAYGEAAPAYSAVYAGWQGADDASVLTAPVAFACAYTQGSAVGTYSITPNSAVAANYAITYVPGTLTVQSKSSSTSADITATQATGEQLVYNGTRNKPTVVVKDGTTPLTEGVDYTLTYKGQAAGGYAESAYAPIDAGAYYAVVTLTGNYSGTTQASFTIQKAPLTVTADNFTISYGEAAPAYSVVYTGWQGADDASVLLAPVSLTCAYTQGNAVGTYPITLNSAIAANYVITFVPGTLTVTPVVVSVTGVDVEVAKFADGTTDAVITSVGSLQGVYSSDAVSHTVTAAFSDAAAGEHKTITLTYTLTGDAVQMANYILTPASEVYTTEGVILEPIVPSTDPVTREGVLLYGGVEVNAYGYCDGEDYSLSYHLSSGLPDQYKIDYADGRFSDVGWTYLSTPGSDGMIEIEVPADMPTGDYTFAVTFRDSRFTHLESDPCLVTIHVNLPESYVTALMGNVIVLIDTCKCFTDVQWFHRSSSTDVWQAIPGATDYYYKEEGGLTGEYFVRVRMDGVETFTCPQTDVETLYDPANRPAAAKVSVHPNPVQTTATVTIEDSQTEDHTLRIVSMNGWEVENRSFDGNTTTIDMSGCQVGNYMISVDGIVVKVIKK
ncbi:MAG: hypothetical protein IKN59_09070 [Paludibacteraceae bacterium]|nr:hypothetical protein [Paludibacteraceae bacterium]